MWERSPETVKSAWQAAVLVTARAYDLSHKVLGRTTPGGRGARTPPPYWFPRKVAIYVAVAAADCTYAALAREIGMHRDTVTSQCGEVREEAEADRPFARLVETLVRNSSARTVGLVDTAMAQLRADREHLQSLRSDRLATATPPAEPRKARGRPTIVRQIMGGVERPHENLIVGAGE